MKILVTGGAGFIGKYLVRSLLENGDSVTIFDNFSNSTKDSISSLVDIGVKIIEGDITKPLEILNAVKDQDIVIHLAAKISVSESIKNPAETFRVNVDGTRNVLVACEKNHVKKLIVSSSAAVYGEGSPNVKLTEESKTNPISPYGESKVRMEQEIREFESKHDIDCIILRFFNIYGIGQSSEYAGVITKFMEKIKQGKPLEIFGDGLQTRDFVAIDDVINSIHNAISYGKSGTYNIASGRVVTIKELAKFMISISGKKLQIQHTAALKMDIRNSQADISLAKKDLWYSPKFELDKIKELLE
ncbi:NAD-dependent epimerase/dehydratase family protein [Marine Group I thaumarchaeote]|uniref:NAD-dependent epimerase/dehydratase family protein n=1 Tax=Marine Group I thaumarchaeote TaxID=2511932 RepID=A0A7K4P2M9_9ARCH|nr:NAD-dependent epimerase/dehydratase family protein [Marine Group I thaumarchaeote]